MVICCDVIHTPGFHTLIRVQPHTPARGGVIVGVHRDTAGLRVGPLHVCGVFLPLTVGSGEGYGSVCVCVCVRVCVTLKRGALAAPSTPSLVYCLFVHMLM